MMAKLPETTHQIPLAPRPSAGRVSRVCSDPRVFRGSGLRVHRKPWEDGGEVAAQKPQGLCDGLRRISQDRCLEKKTSYIRGA